MALDKIMTIAASAMNAQTVRLNATASNLANSNVMSSTPEGIYKGKRAIFETIMQEQMSAYEGIEGGVKVSEIVNSEKPGQQIYDPSNPNANEQGYIYSSNVNTVEEMIEMLDASRAYQNNVEVISTAKELMMRTLEITKV
jgi:flagellar basal-body rod protein FlgC